MPIIDLPVDGEQPYGVKLRAAINGVNDAVDDILEAWTSYTPTLTNFTLGNGTRVAHYKQNGKTVHFKIRLTLGTTSSVTGNPTFTLPVTAVSATTLFGKSFYNDASVGFFDAGLIQDSATVISTRAVNASATYATYTAVSSTIPFTWTTNDYIDIGGTYEAA